MVKPLIKPYFFLSCASASKISRKIRNTSDKTKIFCVSLFYIIELSKHSVDSLCKGLGFYAEIRSNLIQTILS